MAAGNWYGIVEGFSGSGSAHGALGSAYILYGDCGRAASRSFEDDFFGGSAASMGRSKSAVAV